VDVPIVKSRLEQRRLEQSRLEQRRLEQSRLELGAVICTKLEHLVVACRRNKPSSERRSSTLAAVVCAIDSRFTARRGAVGEGVARTASTPAAVVLP